MNLSNYYLTDNQGPTKMEFDGRLQNEGSNNYRTQPIEKTAAYTKVKGKDLTVASISNVIPRVDLEDHNFITHQLSRKSRKNPLEDNEYFSNLKQEHLLLKETESKCIMLSFHFLLFLVNDIQCRWILF